MSEKMNSEFRDLWVAYCEQKEEVAALTEQVATLTGERDEWMAKVGRLQTHVEMNEERADEGWSNAADANNDLAYVTASKNVAERERDEYQRIFRASDEMLANTQVAHARESLRALAAEQRVKELEGVVDAVRQWGEYTPRRVARALAALTGTEPGE